VREGNGRRPFPSFLWGRFAHHPAEREEGLLNQILAAATWWLCLEIIGWAAWPLTATFLGSTASRGAAFAKHLGLLMAGYLLWLLVSLKLLGNTRAAIVLVLVLVAGLSLHVSRRQRLLDLWRAQRRELFGASLLFLVAFAGYLAFRAYDPSVSHTEQPMDFGFLNAILRSPTFPPNDMWLSGYAISYYYFGYLLMAMVAKLAAVPSGIAYNLALGTVFALTVTGAYGLVRDLAARGAGVHAHRLGLLGAAFVALAGNLEGFLELLHANGIGSAALWSWVNIPALAQAPARGGWLPGLDWWWWRATRLIQDVNPLGKLPEVITEFPSFSFILGDLHPHVMALPFGLLALAVAWNLLAAAPDLPEGTRVEILPGRSLAWPALPPLPLLVPLVIGALGFLNSWDFPTYALVAVAAYAIGRAWHHRQLDGAWASESAGFAAIVLALGFAFYLPFYIGFRSQAAGLGVVSYAKTPWLQYVLIFGLFLAVVVPWALGQGLALVRQPRFGRAYAVALVAALILPAILAVGAEGPSGVLLALFGSAIQAPWLALGLALLVALVAALLWTRLHAPEADSASTFALLLALAGLLLTFATEFVFIRDSFGTRMNTMFKFYYQAWVLLGIAAAWGVSEVATRRGPARAAHRLWLGVVACALAAALYYPAAAATSKANLFAGPPTLDGTAWLDPASGEGAAIAWLGQHAAGSAVIVEAPGDEYNPAHDRVSAWTGLPTVLGWAGHEGQWGRDGALLAERQADVAAIYQGHNAAAVRALLDKYGVQYVYVGPYERQKYGLSADNLALLDRVMARAYDRDGVIIYER